MDKENWNLSRRPLVGGRLFERDGARFKSHADNVLGSNKKLNKEFMSSNSQRLVTKSLIDHQDSSSSTSSSMLLKKENGRDPISHQRRLLPEGKASDNSHPRYISMVQEPSPYKHSAVKLRKEPCRMLRKINSEEFSTLAAKIKARRMSSIHQKDQNSSEKNSVKKDYQLSLLRFPRSQQTKLISPKVTVPEIVMSDHSEDPISTWECRRALCFSDIQEYQEEDHTEPLNMMDITSMISGASVLQNPAAHQNEKKHPGHELEWKFSRENKENSNPTQIIFQDNGKELDSELIHTEERKIFNKEIDKTSVLHKRASNSADSKRRVIKKLDTKVKMQKRRSALVAVNSAIHGMKRNMKFDRASKHIPLASQKIKQTVTVSTKGEHCPDIKSLRTPEVVIDKPGSPNFCHVSTNTEVVEEKPKIVNTCDASTNTEVVEEKPKIVNTCDASTSTDVSCLEKLPGILVAEVAKLNEEQEQIDKKANQLLQQTLERRELMKDSHMLQSFMTSVSPLKRLRSMMLEKPTFLDNLLPSSSDSADVNPETKEECLNLSLNSDDSNIDDSSMWNATHNETVVDISPFNTSNEMNASHLKWKHLKLNSRIFHPPSTHQKKSVKIASPMEEETFDRYISEDLSPFTEMVGDCERPSLAPMTPHSHQQVSMIKMSLRKQLDQLYDS